MKLSFRKIGEGSPVIILHGLFGLSDNWQSFAKQLEQRHKSVYLPDLRNHGNSPHSSEFDFSSMAADVLGLIESERIDNPVLMGHSLGGKTVMQFALNYPDKISSIVVIDIAPKYYAPHHQQILEGLFAVNLHEIRSRNEADKILTEKIPDISTRQFLLKNLYWEEKEKLNWKFNLRDIANSIENVGAEIKSSSAFHKPALFIGGEKSNYITASDTESIKKLFPQSEILSAPDAGHWVHADNPAWLLEKVLEFTDS